MYLKGISKCVPVFFNKCYKSYSYIYMCSISHTHMYMCSFLSTKLMSLVTVSDHHPPVYTTMTLQKLSLFVIFILSIDGKYI